MIRSKPYIQAGNPPTEEPPDMKELVESLSNPDISKRDYDNAIKQIGNKANEIWRYICKASERHLDWWAFRNDLSLGHGDGSTGGYFDPAHDSEFIEITGDRSEFVTTVGDYETYDNPHYKYNEGFPTELLWDDNWQATVDQHIENAINTFSQERAAKLEKNKEKKARKKDREKVHAQMMKEIWIKVQAALTKEEYELLLSKVR